MKEKPKVSVIVPTYNVVSYIRGTLDSFSRQTLEGIEWIFVDDGSTDDTPKVIQNYLYKGLLEGRLLRTNRGGAGKARNIGVKEAHGTYISFMDSDDLIAPDKYARMFHLAEKWHSDLVINGLVYLQNYGSVEKTIFRFTDPVNMYLMEKNKVFNPSQFPELISSCYLWNRLYRRDWYLESNITIPEGRKFAEDLLPCVMSTVMAKRVSFLTQPMNIYVQHENSLTDQMNTQENKIDFLVAMKETKKFLLQTNSYDVFGREFLRFTCSIAFGLAAKIPGYDSSNKFYKELAENISKEDLNVIKGLGFDKIFPVGFKRISRYIL